MILYLSLASSLENQFLCRLVYIFLEFFEKYLAACRQSGKMAGKQSGKMVEKQARKVAGNRMWVIMKGEHYGADENYFCTGSREENRSRTKTVAS